MILKGAIFTREGYEQTGWTTRGREGGDVFYNFGTYTIYESITLYPVWTKIPSSGGAGSSGSGSSNTTSVSSSIKSGTNITIASLEQLISGGKTLTVEGQNGAKLLFDTEALKGIYHQAAGNI